MRFGICSNPAQAAQMAEIGADFVEWNVSANVGTASDDEFGNLAKTAERLPLRPETWNILLPGEIKVVGPAANADDLRAYAERALPRVRQLGGEVVVFGSGRSRTIPDGWPVDAAREQFTETCRVLADIAEANGLVIALEPLRTEETNLTNRVDEGLQLVQQIGRAGFELLADLYHMAEQREPFSHLQAAAPHLTHVHIAAPGSRGVPLEADDTAVLGDFLRALRGADYDRRVSFECRSSDPEELREGLAIARGLWDAAG